MEHDVPCWQQENVWIVVTEPAKLHRRSHSPQGERAGESAPRGDPARVGLLLGLLPALGSLLPPRSALQPGRLRRRQHVQALLPDLACADQQVRVRGDEQVCSLTPFDAAHEPDEPPDPLPEEEVTAHVGRVHAHAQARDVYTLRDHLDGHDPALIALAERSDPQGTREESVPVLGREVD